MSGKIISREVGEQGKGFRLQRLRAINLILDEMQKSENIAVYAATEYFDDVYLKTVQSNDFSLYAEGDKDYASKKSFSFMSNEVRNSVVSFLDCWCTNEMSNRLQFGFYTNVEVGKENNTEKTKSLGVVLPDIPIIRLLSDKNYYYMDVIDTAIKIIMDEYKSQYSKVDSIGHLDIIENFNKETWIDFFDRIQWKFGQEDDVELEEQLLKKIANIPGYNIDLQGKEKYVLSSILSMFEARQNQKDPLSKLVSASDVKVVILELSNRVNKRNDTMYELWESLDDPIDKRNLKEKIKAVCHSYKDKKINILARKVAAVKQELGRIDSKDRGSYQYRVFESAEQTIFELLESQTDEITPKVIDHWIEIISEKAQQHIDEKSKDFYIAFTNKDTLRNTILELIDSCFLSFDEGSN